jgi:hypothetical protein
MSCMHGHTKNYVATKNLRIYSHRTYNAGLLWEFAGRNSTWSVMFLMVNMCIMWPPATPPEIRWPLLLLVTPVGREDDDDDVMAICELWIIWLVRFDWMKPPKPSMMSPKLISSMSVLACRSSHKKTYSNGHVHNIIGFTDSWSLQNLVAISPRYYWPVLLQKQVV